MRILILVVFLALLLQCTPTQQTTAPSGTSSTRIEFVEDLLRKMTIDEKIGQLNLVTPGGGIATGAVVSSDVETKIKAGNVGGLFGVIGAEKIKVAQDFAVNNSRLKIPLIFGSDIIHGYKTIFPIPLGLSCSWDTVTRPNLAAGTRLIRRNAVGAFRTLNTRQSEIQMQTNGLFNGISHWFAH